MEPNMAALLEAFGEWAAAVIQGNPKLLLLPPLEVEGAARALVELLGRQRAGQAAVWPPPRLEPDVCLKRLHTANTGSASRVTAGTWGVRNPSGDVAPPSCCVAGPRATLGDEKTEPAVCGMAAEGWDPGLGAPPWRWSGRCCWSGRCAAPSPP